MMSRGKMRESYGRRGNGEKGGKGNWDLEKQRGCKLASSEEGRKKVDWEGEEATCRAPPFVP